MFRVAIFLFFISQLTSNVNSQSSETYFSEGDNNLYSIFEAWEAQDWQVAYSPNIVKNKQILFSQQIKTNNINAVEQLIVAQTKYELSVIGRVIAIRPKPQSSSQFTISGKVSDLKTGEVLIGATLSTHDFKVGTMTNEYGKYSLTLASGQVIIRTSYIGYTTRIDTFELNQHKIVEMKLKESSINLNEIMVSSKEADFNISSMITGTNSINLKNEGQIPYFLGEVDVLQGALLLPGIKSIGEDANGIYIRGGNVDQNLILMDEAPIYNPNHFYGLVSVFNPEMVNNIEILKGFAPPKYGGRSSSVINVHQRNGDLTDYHFTGGVSFISAKGVYEGPIIRDKSSFIISARRSLLNRLSLFSNTAEGTNSFQDINIKVNYIQNQNSTFFIAGYLGSDKNRDVFSTTTKWGNSNLSLRWNYTVNPRLIANFSAVISRYQYNVEQPKEAASFISQSRIIDYNLKSDFSFFKSSNHQVDFGASMILHRLKPGDRFPFDINTSTDTLLLDSEHALESGVYINHQYKMSDKLTLNYGFRQSIYQFLGAGEVYTYSSNVPKSDESIIDTTRFESGQTMKFYQGFEPRISINWNIRKNQALKASYNRNYQYLHLISTAINPSPTDIWKLSDTHIEPTNSHQVSLGYYLNSHDNSWEMSAETYLRSTENTISYKNGADLLFNSNPETELINGIGRAYGLELFIKRNIGKIKGWVSYTLSKSEEQVNSPFIGESVNNGNYFPSDHDRTHYLSVVCAAELGNRWNASLSFNYGTGRPVTLPVAKYEIDGKFVPHFEERNQSRLPDYHRLDLSLRLNGKKVNKKGKEKQFADYWTLVLYNVYARKNAYSYVFRGTDSNVNDIGTFSIIEGIVPGITYNFSF